MKKSRIFLLIFICASAIPAKFFLPVASSQQEVNKRPEFAGNIFGQPVPIDNYYFVKNTILVFGNKWGAQPRTAQELEDCVWNDLVLSYEAFRRNIVVNREEVESEVDKTLKGEKVGFDWKKDKEAYQRWAQERMREPIELFENQIMHLMQLEKLRKQVMDSIEPQVQDKEAYQEFLNEYNTLSIELAQFDAEKDAVEFYNKVKSNPKLWEAQKEKEPDRFKRPGFVALEFLMDMWGLPYEAVYKMMDMEIGAVYPPAPVYKGFGVFKILEKRPADLSKYAQLKNSYFEQVKQKKKYKGLTNWIKDLKTQADIRVYTSK